MSLNKSIIYLNPQETAKGIAELADKIEYMKILYRNQGTSSQKAILDYEKDIRSLKWGIIFYLNNESNYADWKAAPKNNSLLLFKYFNKGHFSHEIGQDQELSLKLVTDYKVAYNNIAPELLLTNKEKQTLASYQEKGIPVEDHYQYTAEEQLILNLYDKAQCFDKNFRYLMENVPDNKKLPKEGQNAVALIRSNPLLMADNPNHFIINRDRATFPTVSCEKLTQILLDSTVGDADAIAILKRIAKTLERLDGKESQLENIKAIRKSSNDNTLDITKKHSI